MPKAKTKFRPMGSLPKDSWHPQAEISKRTSKCSQPHHCAQEQAHDTKPTYKSTAKMSAVQSVQCFGKKKTATAVAHCRQGKGLIRVNGKPLSLVEPQILRFKVYEPVLILGLDKFGMLLSVEGRGGIERLKDHPRIVGLEEKTATPIRSSLE